jgi:hypothetical protein
VTQLGLCCSALFCAVLSCSRAAAPCLLFCVPAPFRAGNQNSGVELGSESRRAVHHLHRPSEPAVRLYQARECFPGVRDLRWSEPADSEARMFGADGGLLFRGAVPPEQRQNSARSRDFGTVRQNSRTAVAYARMRAAYVCIADVCAIVGRLNSRGYLKAEGPGPRKPESADVFQRSTGRRLARAREVRA